MVWSGRPGGCEPGGICKLLELADAHPSEIRADFRSKFGLSWDDVGVTVSWVEAAHLVNVLLRDPESWLQAAHNGWSYPVPRVWELLAHLIDITLQINSKKGNKPKPLKRPWPDPGKKKVGRSGQDRARVLAHLERMNPRE